MVEHEHWLAHCMYIKAWDRLYTNWIWKFKIVGLPGHLESWMIDTCFMYSCFVYYWFHLYSLFVYYCFFYFSKLCFPWNSNGQAYDDFVDYFAWTWLNGNFSLSKWNDDGPCTNNLEGWDSRVKTLAGKAHLNISEMVELFKTEQSHMEASILQLAAGGTVRSKGPSRKRNEERIKKIEDKFDAGDFFWTHST